ncbi:MAG: DinB family protein [Chitinophagaceae bacterium]|nr:DinB family protein [Chitinophagaceae bacterium]
MPKPSSTSYPGYFQRYIDQVPETEMMPAFKNQTAGIADFLNSITEEKSNDAYAEGKWTIKELLQHITDAERIFNYRALCIARGEKQNLPGFEEDDYAANSHANRRSWKSLVEEFILVRKGTEMLYESFSVDVINNSGSTNNNPTTVASIAFITAGHYYHHKKILQERYL